ncbi:hypothetical protein [Cohnella sp. OV330]|uniref:hypothetical protein n=1 Tax=Cohnella sp. OV330 TaxID=1855288 RepID=UPI000B7C801E|nr:hypothetical protein [Cohnella sp. OV330]
MPNEKGWYTKEEVIESGLPYYIPASERWTKMPYEFAILLTRSRSKELGVPIIHHEHAVPAAFRYAAAAGTGTTDKKHRYIPLYDRTGLFPKDVGRRKFYNGEIMTKSSEAASAI